MSYTVGTTEWYEEIKHLPVIIPKEILFDIPEKEGWAFEQAAQENGIIIENKGINKRGLLSYELVINNMWELLKFGHDLENINIPVNPTSGQPVPKTNLKKMWDKYNKLIKPE